MPRCSKVKSQESSNVAFDRAGAYKRRWLTGSHVSGMLIHHIWYAVSHNHDFFHLHS